MAIRGIVTANHIVDGGDGNQSDCMPVVLCQRRGLLPALTNTPLRQLVLAITNDVHTIVVYHAPRPALPCMYNCTSFACSRLLIALMVQAGLTCDITLSKQSMLSLL